MLANISIRAKIITVVAFLLVAMAGMGLLAVMNMRAINANTVDITTSWMPSVRVLGDLRAGVITYRNVIREHMLAETLEEKLAAEKTLATVVEGNTKIRASLRADDHLAGRAGALQRLGQDLGRLQEGHRGSHGAVAQGGRQGPARGP